MDDQKKKEEKHERRARKWIMRDKNRLEEKIEGLVWVFAFQLYDIKL